MPITVDCPSGLTLIMRGFVGKDARFLSDRQLGRSGKIVDAMLGACLQSVESLGPYEFDTDKPLPWGKVLVGDRDYALVRIRSATYPGTYDFDLQCEACREKFAWSINLDELPVRRLSEESSERFKNGNRFETTVPGDERRLEFKLALGEDSIAAVARLKTARQRSGSNPLIDSLLMRTLSVEGVDQRPKSMRDYFENLEMGYIAELVSRLDDQDCGVETSIEVECPHCLRQQDVDLPFGEGFFFPARSRKRAAR